MTWLIVSADGELTIRADEMTLEALQQAVDGYAEQVASPDPSLPVTVFINEERTSHSTNAVLTLNVKATTFLQPVLWPGTRIVGPMVIAGEVKDAETTPLSDELLAIVQERLGG